MLLVKQVAHIQRQVGPFGDLVVQRRIKQRGPIALLGIGSIHVVRPHIPRAQADAHVSARYVVVAPQRCGVFGRRGELIALQGRAVIQRPAQHLGLHIGVSTNHADVLRDLRLGFQVQATHA
ncbi:hypothetical protein D3C71_1844700 [compost metagenome]